MKHDDEEDKSWENETCVDVGGLEDNHSITIDCKNDKNFTLTFNGLDHGKTELVIANVTKSSSPIPPSNTSTTSVPSTTVKPTTSSSASSTSHQIVEEENAVDDW